MCLAVPAKIMTLEPEGEAVVDMHGNQLKVNVVLVPESRLGDWVLVHAGFAIQRIDEREAAETWALLEEVSEAESAAQREARP